MGDLQKRTADTFDGYGKKYSETVNGAISFTGMKVDFFTRVKADYLIALADKQFGDRTELSILDIGCGVGNFHELLGSRFANLEGVDVSAACIAQARQMHPELNYKVYDGHRLPYEDDGLDLAFAICVVHHVPPENRPAFFSEMNRVLKPGGMAVVFEHNPRNPLTIRAVNRCPFDEDAVLLTSREATKLMTGAGLTSIQTRFILSVPPGNRLMRKIDGLLSPLTLGAQYYVSASKP